MRNWVLINSFGVGAFSLMLWAFPISADQNWDGDNSVGNFSYDNNWYSNVQPSWGFGGNLWFNYRNNSSQTSLYYDYGGAWKQTGNISWASTFAASLALDGNGNGLDFNQKVENYSSYTQTINIPLSGAKNGAGQIELNPVNGDLVLNGALYNDNKKPVRVYGSNGKTLTLNNNITGAGVDFSVEQNSTAILAGSANSYSGTTQVKAGKLLVNGTHSNGGDYTVSSGALLGGSGVIDLTSGKSVSVSSGGFLAPGNAGIGQLSGNTPFTLSSNATYQIELKAVSGTATAGTDNDVLKLTGGNTAAFTVGGATLQLDLVGVFGVGNLNKTYRIVDATGINKSVNFSSVFANLSNVLGVYKYNQAGVKADVNFNSQYIDITLTAVPEPTFFGLLAGAVGVGFCRRHRR